MKIEDEKKEIEKLKKAKLREYTVDNFKKYWTHDNDYKSKKMRKVNEKLVIVYSLWHKRLLARIFYFEEFFENKKLFRDVFEIQRQVAGFENKLSKRVYYMCGLRVWTGDDYLGWQIVNSRSYQFNSSYYGYSAIDSSNFAKYNDPYKYLNKSVHKYCAYEYFPEKEKCHNHMFDYLIKYEKHPELEMLLKMGLSNLTYDLTPIRWSKKGIDMLGVTKQELHYLKSIKLRNYRKIRTECLKNKFTVKEAKVLEVFIKNKTNLDYTPRLIRYLAKNDINIGIYEDYIRMMEQLGLPKENRYLYPKEFSEMHDNLSERIELNKSQALAEKMLEMTKNADKLCISDQEYKIVLLNKPIDLIKEGKFMHHCVGSYAKRVADGECIIYSVRKNEDPYKPLATIEVRGKKVNQVRAEHNNIPDENISNFVRKWEHKFRLSGW